MKVIGILISFLLFSMAIIAQQGTYTRIFSGYSYDEGIAAFRLPNKEIRLVGNTGSFGNGSTDVWLIALDSNGEFLWHKFYSGPNVEKVTSAIITPQGDIFMVGTTTQNTANSYQLYFLGLDQYGQVIVSKNYGGQNWDFGYGICQINDTSFALVGETYSQGAGASDLYLIKVNRQGDTAWTKTFGGIKEDRGNSVKLMPDSGLIIVGATKSFGNGSLDSYMLRLDANGDTLWTKVVPNISDAEFLSVAIDPDTSIVCSGYKSDSLNTYRDIDIQKFYQNADFHWSAHLLAEGEDCYATSIFRETNGDYTYTGITTRFSSTQYSNARITKIISSGWYKASRKIGHKNEDVGNMVSVDNFNGKHYLFIGTTKNFGVDRSGILFIRLDSTFQYDTTRLVETPTGIYASHKPETLKVYPNPVSDLLSIELPYHISKAKIMIFDITGKLVFSKNMATGIETYNLSVDGFVDGIYQLIIYDGQKQFQARFVKTSI